MLSLILDLVDRLSAIACDPSQPSDTFARGMLAGGLEELALVVEHAMDEEDAALDAMEAASKVRPVIQRECDCADCND